jgi:hypothetical protein
MNSAIPDFANTENLILNCGALIKRLQLEQDPLPEEVLTSMRDLINILQNTDSSLSVENFTDIGELGIRYCVVYFIKHKIISSSYYLMKQPLLLHTG